MAKKQPPPKPTPVPVKVEPPKPVVIDPTWVKGPDGEHYDPLTLERKTG